MYILEYINRFDIIWDVIHKEEVLNLAQDYVCVIVRVPYIEGVENKIQTVIELSIYDTNLFHFFLKESQSVDLVLNRCKVLTQGENSYVKINNINIKLIGMYNVGVGMIDTLSSLFLSKYKVVLVILVRI